jgi:8-oxo-dGTP pyrophosphatase MutT (NUDIX family)
MGNYVRGIILDKNNQVLVAYNRKFEYWDFPGGKVEQSDTDTEDAVCREIREEIGLTVTSANLVFSGNVKFPDLPVEHHGSYYSLKAANLEITLSESDEINSCKFISLGELKRHMGLTPPSIANSIILEIYTDAFVKKQPKNLVDINRNSFELFFWGSANDADKRIL